MQPSFSNRLPAGRLAVCAAVVCLLVAASAEASLNVSQCRRLTRQIDRFESVAEMAEERGDEMWRAGTMAHLQRLTARHVRLCPQEKPDYVLMMTKWMGKTVKKAGRTFLRYLTFGAY